MTDDLPLPDPVARMHSERVVACARAEIAAGGGFIGFERYMEIVLYAPGLGYYVAGARKLGGEGDFVTAPELTPLYGAALARQIGSILDATGTRDVIELGAGSGALAHAILARFDADDRADARLPRRNPPLRYSILEVSPELRARQQATLADDAAPAVAPAQWFETLPSSIDGVVLLNEVLDALPPRVIARRQGAWRERGVTWKGAALAWAERPLDDPRMQALACTRFPDEGDYVSEINPAAEALVASLARRLHHGAILIVDYGFPRAEYFHPQRTEGTLVGHYRHRVHADPFLWPGLSDLTAHVDFTAIAEAAESAGLRVAGFATQTSFLLGCGILDRLTAVGTPDSLAYLREAAAVQKLVSPAEMGELFKVMLLAPESRAWQSLAVTDLAHRL
ncbi:MAG: class I SAM-dependent methyltransferase [Casimicrobiaceae bacterium]